VKILIADDSPTARTVVQRAIQRIGHDCLVAIDGAEAWEMFQQANVDAVISDWLMPRLDGLQLCHKVRTAPDRPYTYFILLTAVSDKKHVLQAMQSGVDDYLVKPLDHDDLQARLINAERIRALHLKLAKHQRELERLNGLLHDEARTDPLTRLGNRRRMREDLEVLNARAKRYSHSYSLGMIDIDRFKQYNDACGHLAGDDVLRAVAGTIARQCRSGDTAYRYGGEEFVVVLPEQTPATARVLLERIREGIEALHIVHPTNPPSGILTVSAGVAALNGAASEASAEPPIAEADEALYQAKQLGRNRVEVFQPS